MSKKLSKNFSAHEFECSCGKCEQILPSDALVAVAQDIRDHFGVPCTITSNYRCPEHNAKVGGAKHSQHLTAAAIDIQVKGIAPRDVHKYLDEKYKNEISLGLYNSFVHLDLRPGRRW